MTWADLTLMWKGADPTIFIYRISESTILHGEPTWILLSPSLENVKDI